MNQSTHSWVTSSTVSTWRHVPRRPAWQPGPAGRRPGGPADDLGGTPGVLPRSAGRQRRRLAAGRAAAADGRSRLGRCRPLPQCPPRHGGAELDLGTPGPGGAADGSGKPGRGRSSRPARPAPAPDRLLAVVAGILRSDPGATLRQIGARLEAIREPTSPRRHDLAAGIGGACRRPRQEGRPVAKPVAEATGGLSIHRPAIPAGASQSHQSGTTTANLAGYRDCGKPILSVHPGTGRII